MQTKLGKYLSQIEKQLAELSTEQREEELREIRSHLEMMIDENVARGINPDEATTKALEQFGEANKLGKELRQYKTFAWLHYFRPLAAFLFALGVVIAWVSISSVPVQWPSDLMLIIIIFPITGWVAEMIAPKCGFWSLAVLFYGILSLFICLYVYIVFWKSVPIPKAYLLVGFISHGLLGIASFIGVWIRRWQVKHRKHQTMIVAE